MILKFKKLDSDESKSFDVTWANELLTSYELQRQVYQFWINLSQMVKYADIETAPNS